MAWTRGQAGRTRAWGGGLGPWGGLACSLASFQWVAAVLLVAFVGFSDVARSRSPARVRDSEGSAVGALVVDFIHF